MSANGRSILLVDDDQEIREMETYLSRAGFQVRSVSRGADSARRCARRRQAWRSST